MQQRVEPHDSLEYFPTPPWAARALCEFLAAELGEPLDVLRCWEPACGEGHLAKGLRDYFEIVRETDVAHYDPDHGICDFVDRGARQFEADWIITNPPFALGEQFVQLANERTRRGCAMFVRSAFAESGERYHTLFSPDERPAYELVFCERVVLLKGRLIQSGKPDPFNLDEDGKPKRASSATAYSWLIWLPGNHDTRKRWIRPGTRRLLERPGDYPDYKHLFPEKEGSLL